jgi:hypothetical protein
MDSVPDALAFLQGQAAFHERKGQMYEQMNPRRSAQHVKLSEQFAELIDFLQRQAAHVDNLEGESPVSVRPVGPVQLSLRLEDIDGLPEELIRELSITDGDKAEFTIQALMHDHGGVMSLDQLLIGLYRKTGEIHKRSNLNARLYRMTKKNSLFDVPGRKGVYSVRPLSDDEARTLEGPAVAEATP